MKRVIIIAVIALFPLSLCAQNKMDSQGRRQGKWEKVDKNNRKVYEGVFKDGLETGVFTYYYGDGSVRMKNTFIKDGVYCKHEAYDKNGNIMVEGFYNQKNRDSVWTIYSEKGNVLKMETYKMGTKNGKSVLFSAKGDTVEIQYWNDDKKHGYWYRKTLNGYLKGNYKDGLLNGKFGEYIGGKLATEGCYENGLRVNQWKYWNGNNLEKVERWSEGIMVSRKVLIYSDKPQMIDISDIAYFYPKGQKTIVITMQGETLIDNENSDILFGRLGSEYFVTLNKERKLVASYSCIKGFDVDEDGKQYVVLEPELSFRLYPDEDCMKLVKSIIREGLEN